MSPDFGRGASISIALLAITPPMDPGGSNRLPALGGEAESAHQSSIPALCHISATLSTIKYLYGDFLSVAMRAKRCQKNARRKEISMRTVIVLLGAVLVLSACNTVNGIGRDVQSVGETVSDAAN